MLVANLRIRVLSGCLIGGLGLLAGCTNGGGDNPPPAAVVPANTTLATKADAQRELGNLGSMASGFSPSGSGLASAPPAFGSSPAKPKLGLFRLPARTRTAGSTQAVVTPQTAQTTNCTGGGTSTADSGAKSRTFAFFPTTQTVNWNSSSDSNCVEAYTNSDGSGSTFTTNGAEEDGYSATGYSYVTFGSGSAPVHFVDTERSSSGATTSSSVINVLGNYEEFDASSTSSDVRISMSEDGSDTTGGQTTSGTAVLGNGSTPLRLTFNSSPSTLTIDGTFTYSTNAPSCSGGTEDIATLQAIVLDSNDNPIGGQLRISSGGKSVTITFNADGSANLAFSDGSSSSMTAAEVQQALFIGSCDGANAN